MLIAVCACLFKAEVFGTEGRDLLPHLAADLHLEDDVESFSSDSVHGGTVSNGRHKLSRGFWKRDQVLAAFGPPPNISWESGREMWCYRLPANRQGENLHLTVCFEGWCGLDELTGFTLGKSKWVVFDEPNYNPSPAAEVWNI